MNGPLRRLARWLAMVALAALVPTAPALCKALGDLDTPSAAPHCHAAAGSSQAPAPVSSAETCCPACESYLTSSPDALDDLEPSSDVLPAHPSPRAREWASRPPSPHRCDPYGPLPRVPLRVPLRL